MPSRPTCHMGLLTFSILAIGLSVATQPVAGRTWYITPDGSGDAPTIQAATDSATSGDSILVGPGVYYEQLNLRHNGLVILGELGAEATIVDGGATWSVLQMGSGTIEGLTLRNGLAYQYGGGISIGGPQASVIRRCIIEGNQSGREPDSAVGGGIFNNSIGTTIEDNIIRNNFVLGEGGGIYDIGDATVIARNVIVANRAQISTGGLGTFRATVVDNIIAGNDGGYNAGGVRIEGALLRNNTIVGNLTTNGFRNAAGVDAGAGDVRMENNIVADNHSSGGEGVGIVIGGSLTIPPSCNVAWGNDIDILGPWGPNNFILDPEFCAVQPATSLNFFIQEDSPCAPGKSPSGANCGLIGAAPIGCGSVAVHRSTWADVKRLYR